MYSVVLATVLTAGGASPAWGNHSCHGCCGGYNAFSYSCGGCCGGYSSCYGCCGGYTVSYSCCGGCCGGCYGSCNGCCGGKYMYVYGAYGCGAYCSGCSGNITYYVPAQPEKKDDKKGDKKEEKKGDKKNEKESGARATQATVVVALPADATMMIDDYVSDLTSDSRTFVTPDLIPEKDYYYTIKAEVMRDGRKVTQSQKIFVRAGRTTRVEFGEMAETAARR